MLNTHVCNYFAYTLRCIKSDKRMWLVYARKLSVNKILWNI